VLEDLRGTFVEKLVSSAQLLAVIVSGGLGACIPSTNNMRTEPLDDEVNVCKATASAVGVRTNPFLPCQCAINAKKRYVDDQQSHRSAFHAAGLLAAVAGASTTALAGHVAADEDTGENEWLLTAGLLGGPILAGAGAGLATYAPYVIDDDEIRSREAIQSAMFEHLRAAEAEHLSPRGEPAAAKKCRAEYVKSELDRCASGDASKPLPYPCERGTVCTYIVTVKLEGRGWIDVDRLSGSGFLTTTFEPAAAMVEDEAAFTATGSCTQEPGGAASITAFLIGGGNDATVTSVNVTISDGQSVALYDAVESPEMPFVLGDGVFNEKKKKKEPTNGAVPFQNVILSRQVGP
jgi:hypothetical protein